MYVPVDTYICRANQLAIVANPNGEVPYSAIPLTQCFYPSHLCREPDVGSAPQASHPTNFAPTSAPQLTPHELESGLKKFKAKVRATFHEKFGFEPSGEHRVYKNPYSKYIDWILLPQGYKIPDFTKFNGVDEKSTREHISQYIA